MEEPIEIELNSTCAKFFSNIKKIGKLSDTIDFRTLIEIDSDGDINYEETNPIQDLGAYRGEANWVIISAVKSTIVYSYDNVSKILADVKVKIHTEKECSLIFETCTVTRHIITEHVENSPALNIYPESLEYVKPSIRKLIESTIEAEAIHTLTTPLSRKLEL